jgi:hypothetical protein
LRGLEGRPHESDEEHTKLLADKVEQRVRQHLQHRVEAEAVTARANTGRDKDRGRDRDRGCRTRNASGE